MAGFQIYGGPRSLFHDFKIWPITFYGSGPSEPTLLVVKKSHFDKKYSSYRESTPQNRKLMQTVNKVNHVISSHSYKSAAGMQHTPPKDIFDVSNVNQGQ